MNKFLKLNRLSLMIAIGAVMAFSPSLSADCHIGAALNYMKAHNDYKDSCSGWPYQPGQSQDCDHCLTNLHLACEEDNQPMSHNQALHWYDFCRKLGSAEQKKGKPSVKSHTP